MARLENADTPTSIFYRAMREYRAQKAALDKAYRVADTYLPETSSEDDMQIRVEREKYRGAFEEAVSKGRSLQHSTPQPESRILATWENFKQRMGNLVRFGKYSTDVELLRELESTESKYLDSQTSADGPISNEYDVPLVQEEYHFNLEHYLFRPSSSTYTPLGESESIQDGIDSFSEDQENAFWHQVRDDYGLKELSAAQDQTLSLTFHSMNDDGHYRYTLQEIHRLAFHPSGRYDLDNLPQEEQVHVLTLAQAQMAALKSTTTEPHQRHFSDAERHEILNGYEGVTRFARMSPAEQIDVLSEFRTGPELVGEPLPAARGTLHEVAEELDAVSRTGWPIFAQVEQVASPAPISVAGDTDSAQVAPEPSRILTAIRESASRFVNFIRSISASAPSSPDANLAPDRPESASAEPTPSLGKRLLQGVRSLGNSLFQRAQTYSAPEEVHLDDGQNVVASQSQDIQDSSLDSSPSDSNLAQLLQADSNSADALRHAPSGGNTEEEASQALRPPSTVDSDSLAVRF